MTVLVFAAHPDDEVIGPGATIAKYAKKEDVIVVIFSCGDSKFWSKFLEPTKESSMIDTVKTRMRETKKACEVLGVKAVVFLRLRDMNISKQIRSRQIEKRIKALIERYKPRLVMYHSQNDGHIDHIAVNKLLTKVVLETDASPKVMTYQINMWSFIDMSKSQQIVDVSDTLHLKLKALEKYKSQKKLTNMLKKLIKLKAIVAGRKIDKKYAELFYEV